MIPKNVQVLEGASFWILEFFFYILMSFYEKE